MNLRAALFVFKKRIQGLKHSELRLIILAMIMLIFGVKQLVFVLTGWGNIVELEKTATQLHAQQNSLSTALSTAVNPQLLADYQQLQQTLKLRQLQLIQTNQQVEQLSAFLVAPQRMTQILQSMLAGHDDVKLVSVSTLPIEELKDANAQVYAYRHKFQLQLDTNYVALTAWLQEIEQLPDRLFWYEIELITKKYPDIGATLIVYTLSDKKGWLGV